MDDANAAQKSKVFFIQGRDNTIFFFKKKREKFVVCIERKITFFRKLFNLFMTIHNNSVLH